MTTKWQGVMSGLVLTLVIVACGEGGGNASGKGGDGGGGSAAEQADRFEKRYETETGQILTPIMREELIDVTIDNCENLSDDVLGLAYAQLAEAGSFSGAGFRVGIEVYCPERLALLVP